MERSVSWVFFCYLMFRVLVTVIGCGYGGVGV